MLNSLNLSICLQLGKLDFLMNPFKERQIFADNFVVGQKNLTSENLKYFDIYGSTFANPRISGKNIEILADPI